MDSLQCFLPDASRPATTTSLEGWYLVQCKPREDRRAVENLSYQGFEAFAPRCMVDRLRNRRWQPRLEALFPGYAFVLLDRIRHDWGKIRSTRGVSRLVHFGAAYPRVPAQVVARVRGMDGMALKSPCVALERGDRVRILEGPFADVEAIFECHDGNDRVLLLIEFLHRQVRVPMQADAVAPV